MYKKKFEKSSQDQFLQFSFMIDIDHLLSKTKIYFLIRIFLGPDLKKLSPFFQREGFHQEINMAVPEKIKIKK